MSTVPGSGSVLSVTSRRRSLMTPTCAVLPFGGSPPAASSSDVVSSIHSTLFRCRTNESIGVAPVRSSPKSRNKTASCPGTLACVLVRRRNSSLIRSSAFVVRNAFHCEGGKRRKVKRSSPASSRHSITEGQRSRHFFRKRARAWSTAARLSASIIRRYSSASSSRRRAGAFASRLRSLCVLCRRRHKTHYADLRIMPIGRRNARSTATFLTTMSA